MSFMSNLSFDLLSNFSFDLFPNYYHESRMLMHQCYYEQLRYMEG